MKATIISAAPAGSEERHCLSHESEVIRAILFEDSPCCEGQHRKAKCLSHECAWNTQNKGAALATTAVEHEGNGEVFATKAVATQDDGAVLATKAVDSQGNGSVLAKTAV